MALLLNPLLTPSNELNTSVNAIYPGNIVVLQHTDGDLIVKITAFAVWLYTSDSQSVKDGGPLWIIYGSGNPDDMFTNEHWKVMAIGTTPGSNGNSNQEG